MRGVNRMKNIKKIICILLAIIILCSAAIPIFAKEGQRLNFGDLIPSDKIEELENAAKPHPKPDFPEPGSYSRSVSTSLSIDIQEQKSAKITFVLKNTGKSNAVFQFAGKQFEYRVKNSSGQTVYTYSKAGSSTLTLAPDKSKSFSHIWDFKDNNGKRLKGGTYTVTFKVLDKSDPLTLEQSIKVPDEPKEPAPQKEKPKEEQKPTNTKPVAETPKKEEKKPTNTKPVAETPKKEEKKPEPKQEPKQEPKPAPKPENKTETKAEPKPKTSATETPKVNPESKTGTTAKAPPPPTPPAPKQEPKKSTPAQNKVYGTCTASMLAIRSGPSTKYKILGYARKGQKMEILDSSSSWYKVSVNGKTGYSYSKYIDTGKKATSTSNNTSNKSNTPSTSSNTGKKASTTTSKTPSVAYSEEDLYWLSRIIHAEARGEPYEGKVAVGAVVLNRVKSPKFPNTIKGVIFQKGQFSPVSNGSIYNTPGSDSIRAAKDALAGVNPIKDALYFYYPKYSTKKARSWFDTLTFVKKIGNHVFKK